MSCNHQDAQIRVIHQAEVNNELADYMYLSMNCPNSKEWNLGKKVIWKLFEL